MDSSIRKKSSAKPYGRNEMVFDGMDKDRLLATLEKKYIEEEKKNKAKEMVR